MLVEASPNRGELARRLEGILASSAAAGCEVAVICTEAERTIAEAAVGRRFPRLPIIPLAAKCPESLAAPILRRLRADRIGFLPVRATFVDPRWDELPDDQDTLLLWTEPPDAPGMPSAHIRPAGWLAGRSFLENLPEMGTAAEGWGPLALAGAARRAGRAVRWRAAPAVLASPPAGPAGGGRPALGTGSSVLALVPHYRCEAWLAEALESLAAQSLPPDGIAVIDDGSGRPPVDIVARFPRVTLLAATRNVGPYRLVQQVIDETGYDAYLFQDADDWSTEDRLEILLAEAARSGAELVGTQELRVDPDGVRVVGYAYPLDVNAVLAEQPTRTGLLLLHGTSLVSRDLVRRLGGFATGLRFAADSELLRRAAHATRVVNVPRFCYFRRERPDSLTRSAVTGLLSADRLRIRRLLDTRAERNAAAAARGEAPLLMPYAVSGPVRLTHLSGPTLRPAPRAG